MTLKSKTESTNIWDYKPWWCQPWSIILTGIAIITISWILLHILWVTLGISVLITAWWIYFLVIFPQLFAKYMASKPNM